jgi:sigma-B regulation protein RsbU (phosphoserine phosphatase)
LKILIADDEYISLSLLEELLTDWGHEVVAVRDGMAAWKALQGPGAARLAILDWTMPKLEGIEICGMVRAVPTSLPPYILLVTWKEGKQNIIFGLQAGANDYVTKPFDPDELRARVDVGIRMIELQQSLAERVRELELALENVRQLKGLLPICCYCNKIRDDQAHWQQLECYFLNHSELKLSHPICPGCMERELAGPLITFDSSHK